MKVFEEKFFLFFLLNIHLRFERVAVPDSQTRVDQQHTGPLYIAVCQKGL